MSESASKLFQEEGAKEELNLHLPVTEEEVKEEAKEEKEVKEEETKEEVPADDDIQDIVIEGAKRKRFRINGDNDKIIELDTTDLGISYRLQESYNRLNKLMEEVSKTLRPEDDEDVSDEEMQEINSALKKLDDSMKKEIDYIFNSPVSEKCCEGGSMYAPKNGMYRYEYIIDTLSALYENDLNHEFRLMKQRIKERTERFKSPTKKKYRPK